MGCLKDLTDMSKSIHLLQTNSSRAEMYVHDTLKKVYNATLEDMFEVKTKQNIKALYELASVQPYTAEKWIFEIEFKVISDMLKTNKGIFESPNICYVIKVDRYKDFKEFKNGIGSCNDLYLSYLHREDIMYLLSGFSISEKLMNFICGSYSRDVDKVFELREHLLGGVEISTQRDVVNLVGSSQGSINGYVLQLITAPPRTEKGQARVYKNRLQYGLGLCRTYGARTFRNYLASTVHDMLQIKQLYMQGIIYNRVINIPEQYDEKKLSRYNYLLDSIENSLSYEDLLGLYVKLQLKENRVWYTESDFVRFLYDYYKEVELIGTVS